jgi:Na+-transporting NADH:ubiquinone oxidoreductase subunit B
MKALRNFMNKIEPSFRPGGKLAKLESVYDGMETFLFTPNTTSRLGVHIHDGNDLKRTMITVVVALIPALLFGMYNIGYQHYMAIGQPASWFTMWIYGLLAMLPVIVVSYGVGLGIEFISAQIHHKEIQEGFLVTGILIPLIVPINTPLWMTAVATAFAVIFAKEVFGGTGMNIFNVALITRAFLFFAYPSHMSGDEPFVKVDSAFGMGQGTVVDGFTGATPLGQVATTVGDNVSMTNIVGEPISTMDAIVGLIPGSPGETSMIAILLGAALLLLTGIASWRIMCSVFVGGLGMAALVHALPSATYPASMLDPVTQLCLGGFAFGAVFMATDPVTGARTKVGQYIYGLLIGVFAILIRVYNSGYPEGMMLAILLMNAFAPLIDHCVVSSNIKRRARRAATKE